MLFRVSKYLTHIIVALVVLVVAVGTGVTVALVLRNRNQIQDSQDWWKTTVLYQIYPRSFKDSDGDGIGDIRGITENLDLFVEAGIKSIWMSPIFKSPMVDFGYDISDFYDIHEEYGTMEDFDELVDRAHQLGLKVLLDFVPNHASTESDYFLRSLAREEGFEDFFIWDDGLIDPENETNRMPPSNWVSQFGGSTWEWREEREQFYLHQFAIEQADFNFRNPAVRQEMKNIMNFWLQRGADGFRVDALPYVMEADKDNFNGTYPDEPLSGQIAFGPNDLGYVIPVHTKDLLELYDVVYELREFLDEWMNNNGGDTRVMLTEGYANVSRTMLYYGNEEGSIGAHFPFNFDFIIEVNGESSARDLAYTALKWLTYMPEGAVPNWVFGNHDRNRVATRFGTHLVDAINMLNMMLPGVAVTYQGEEIGLENGFVSWEDTVDVQALNMGNADNYLEFSRDPARTPYHWDDSANAGFSTNSSTWLPVAENYITLNLETQKMAARSHFKVYQQLTALRNEITLMQGDYIIKALTDNVLILIRSLAGEQTYTLLANFSEDSQTVSLASQTQLPDDLTVVIASVGSARNEGEIIAKAVVTLSAGEALVLSSPSLDVCEPGITTSLYNNIKTYFD